MLWALQMSEDLNNPKGLHTPARVPQEKFGQRDPDLAIGFESPQDDVHRDDSLMAKRDT